MPEVRRDVEGEAQGVTGTPGQEGEGIHNSMEWLAVRQITMNIDKMDVWIYMTEGRIVEPDTVHHIEPLEDNWSRRKDIDNLMSLTGETHSRIENLYKTEGKEVMEKKLGYHAQTISGSRGHQGV